MIINRLVLLTKIAYELKMFSVEN